MRSFKTLNVWADAARIATALPPSDYVNALVLAANVAADDEIPQGATYVVFGAAPAVNYYVQFVDENDTNSGPAAVPGASVDDGSAAALNPRYFAIPEWATHLSAVSPEGGVLTLSYYAG